VAVAFMYRDSIVKTNPPALMTAIHTFTVVVGADLCVGPAPRPVRRLSWHIQNIRAHTQVRPYRRIRVS
jgi:hypothetical protein